MHHEHRINLSIRETFGYYSFLVLAFTPVVLHGPRAGSGVESARKLEP